MEKKKWTHSIDPKICDSCDYWQPDKQSCLADEEHMFHKLNQPRKCMNEICHQANLLDLSEDEQTKLFCIKCPYYFGEINDCMFEEDDIIRDEPRSCYLKKEEYDLESEEG